MENDGYGTRGTGANLNNDDITITFLPRADSKKKLLHVHFLSAQEQQERQLCEWLDCVTEGGMLVAMQKSSRQHSHPLVMHLVEKWLDHYRPCTSLSDGEEDEDDDDE